MAEGTKLPSSNHGLTARDIELLILAFRSAKGGPLVIDYKVFAELGGFKNAKSAQVSWHGVKKKLDGIAGGSASVSHAPKTTKRKVIDTNGKDGVQPDDDDDEVLDNASLKRVRIMDQTIKVEYDDEKDDLI